MIVKKAWLSKSAVENSCKMRNSSHCGSHHHINMYGFILFSYSNPPPFAMHPQFHSTTTTICHLLQSKYLRALTCCCPPSLMLASRLKQQQTPINPVLYIICHVFQRDTQIPKVLDLSLPGYVFRLSLSLLICTHHISS